MNDDLEAVGGGGDDLLTPKELDFCERYGNPESETYGSATKSAAAAMYVDPRSAGWKLRRRPKIRAKLAEYHEAVAAAVGQVLTDLEHLRRLAVEKGDLQAAVRAVELQGKHLAMFTDRVGLDLPQVQQLSEARIIEGRRLTRLLLMEGAGDAAGLPAPADASGLRTIDAEPAPGPSGPGPASAPEPEGSM